MYVYKSLVSKLDFRNNISIPMNCRNLSFNDPDNIVVNRHFFKMANPTLITSPVANLRVKMMLTSLHQSFQPQRILYSEHVVLYN